MIWEIKEKKLFVFKLSVKTPYSLTNWSVSTLDLLNHIIREYIIGEEKRKITKKTAIIEAMISPVASYFSYKKNKSHESYLGNI